MDKNWVVDARNRSNNSNGEATMKPATVKSVWIATVGNASAVFVAVGISMCPPDATAASFDDIVTIGDSLSDTGNLLELTTAILRFNAGAFPEAFPMTPPYAVGRFSDGPLWVETLADRVGYPQASAPAGVSLGTTVLPGVPGGNNYAIAGAFAGTGGSIFGESPPTGLRFQAEFYLQQHGGVADPASLYVVVGGGNDIRIQTATQPSKVLRDAALYAAAQSYRDVVKRLTDAGAKTFIVANVPDFGATPEARYIYKLPAIATDATNVFNRYADQLLERLAEHQGVTLAKVDMFGLMNAIVRDATQRGGGTFGITNVDTPCLVVPDWLTGGAIPGAGTFGCDVSLFSDYHHPTTKVHELLGNAAAACRLGRSGGDAIIASSAEETDDLLHRFCHVMH
jgi:phospholipase/lecithinase/hemolysin